MKFAIIGYGKMGKAVEAMCQSYGHEIVAIIDSQADWEKYEEQVQQADAAIEFSTPTAAAQNLKNCFRCNIPVVTGTTAWDAHYEEIREICLEQKQSLFTAANFSLGMNVFFKLNSYLARMMNNMSQYKVSLEEIHHIRKLDKPSGTAKQLAAMLIDELDRKKSWTLDKTHSADELLVVAHRQADVPGTHCVSYESDEDKIQISHTAKSREGFARGAMMAAIWLIDKKGIFSMDDFIVDFLQ